MDPDRAQRLHGNETPSVQANARPCTSPGLRPPPSSFLHARVEGQAPETAMLAASKPGQRAARCQCLAPAEVFNAPRWAATRPRRLCAASPLADRASAAGRLLAAAGSMYACRRTWGRRLQTWSGSAVCSDVLWFSRG
ncbi:hypothetical protein PVAP13_4KG237005 [Panicum virgatum]|uniref:Uncharacterized protein n=1 Tax=Panicum virgatum TaxID=38727 RepID=A0A8T0TL49_PANVG|nr:hypothetical protein PVAP13_4KG237005 [Panicum virgatum]